MARVALERARSAPAGHSGAPAVDEAVFSQLIVDLGAERIDEVRRLFLENAALAVDAVRRALECDDVEAAAHAAHRLKSASGFVGARRLAELCAAVEAGSTAGNPGGAMAAELRRTSVDLDRLVGRLGPSGAPGS